MKARKREGCVCVCYDQKVLKKHPAIPPISLHMLGVQLKLKT